MSELFRKAKNHFQQNLPFVVYCKPNSDKIIAIFQNDNSLNLLDETQESGFAFVSFDNKKRYLIPDSISGIYFEKNEISDFIVSNINQVATDLDAKKSFENLVKNGVEAIQKNQFEKVVLSRKEVVEITDFDFELTFKKLLHNYASAFKYCFYHPNIGFWMGATPEQFLKINENKLKTVALAGTQLFDENKEIIWQEKEIQEQKIVTDYIVSNLNVFTNEVSISESYTIQAGTLAHIKTDVEAVISYKNDIEKIINSLHPTPAVCGFPKQKAKEFIIENEGYDREFYAGFLGEWKKDFQSFQQHQSDLFVNLRCMKINKNKAELFVGCGITKDSIAENEFLETVNKSMTIRKVL
jgi:isochorismate synthase